MGGFEPRRKCAQACVSVSCGATKPEMSQQLIRVSKTCTYINSIHTFESKKKEQWLKHIEEITKDLARIQGEELTYEQQEWYDRKMASVWPKPFRPWPKTRKKFEFKTFSFAEVLASVEPLEETSKKT